MPTEIDISLWPRGSVSEQQMATFVERYHQQTKAVQVRLHSMDAENPWADVSRVMTHHTGADISELGASWVESLAATNDLRPFASNEFEALGGADAFLLPALRAERGGTSVYSIPYRADARLILYRRDLLAAAGVDESTAFTTSKNVLQTLESLRAQGRKSAYMAPITTQRFTFLSFVASWVWSAGGDFIDSTGKQVTFTQPEAIAGLADFFRLADYIAPEFRPSESPDGELEFLQGKAAVALSGPWLYFRLQEDPEFAKIKANIGVALPPLRACHGGTHLIIWRHSLHEEAALDFIRFLTGAEVQAKLTGSTFLLPARLEAVQATHYADDPNYQMIVKAIQTGRSYGASSLWSVVEDRLSRMLVNLWAEYHETQNLDLDSFLATRLGLLARRINITLDGG